jgi:hypothetical protein
MIVSGHPRQAMFTCSNCDKEKPDSEEGYVHIAAKVGYFIWPLAFAVPSGKICKNCATKFSVIGLLGFFLLVIVLTFALCKWLKL